MGILKSDIIDRERGMELNLARNEDILDDCSKESRGKHIHSTNNNEETYFCRSNLSWNYLFNFYEIRSKEHVFSGIFLHSLCDHLEFNL